MKNTGNVTVTDLELEDELAGIVLGDLSATTLAPNETATATATYEVQQSDVDAGKIDNKATATGTDPKHNEVSDYGECTVETEKADASIKDTKRSGDSREKVG